MAEGRYELQDEWDDNRNPALIEGDDSLPWLDSDDDERAPAGYDTSRLVILAVITLLVIGAIVAAFLMLRNAASDEPPADGSLIAAPVEPYKTKPEDDGGKTFPARAIPALPWVKGKRARGNWRIGPPLMHRPPRLSPPRWMSRRRKPPLLRLRPAGCRCRLALSPIVKRQKRRGRNW